MRVFAVKTEVIGGSGQHIRYVPAEMARAMVAAGSAQVHNANGKVRSIMLTQPAASFARMIGPPSDGPSFGVRFTRREMLNESGTRIWQHHGRCRDYE